MLVLSHHLLYFYNINLQLVNTFTFIATDIIISPLDFQHLSPIWHSCQFGPGMSELASNWVILVLVPNGTKLILFKNNVQYYLWSVSQNVLKTELKKVYILSEMRIGVTVTILTVNYAFLNLEQ